MRKLFAFILLFSFVSVSCVAAVPDSTTANLAGEALGAAYNYFAPAMPSIVKNIIAIICSVTPMVLLAIQIQLKRDPAKAPISGWVGFILNVFTWYAKNTTTVDTVTVEVPDNSLKKN